MDSGIRPSNLLHAPPLRIPAYLRFRLPLRSFPRPHFLLRLRPLALRPRVGFSRRISHLSVSHPVNLPGVLALPLHSLQLIPDPPKRVPSMDVSPVSLVEAAIVPDGDYLAAKLADNQGDVMTTRVVPRLLLRGVGDIAPPFRTTPGG